MHFAQLHQGNSYILAAVTACSIPTPRLEYESGREFNLQPVYK